MFISWTLSILLSKYLNISLVPSWVCLKDICEVDEFYLRRSFVQTKQFAHELLSLKSYFAFQILEKTEL